MRHYPAYCSDCKRLWLVATDGVPSASPTCPHCQDRGRLVPGAYYSDAASVSFSRLAQAIEAACLSAPILAQLCSDLESALPSPNESTIDQAFDSVLAQLGLGPELRATTGKRVALRMVVTIANTLCQPTAHDSGVMRLPQTIPGLFDLVPKKPARKTRPKPKPKSTSKPEPDRDDGTG